MNSYYGRIYDNLRPLLMPKRVMVIYGPRRVGKTTMINHFLEAHQKEKRILRVSGDGRLDSEVFSSCDPALLLDRVAGYDTVFIDEAQRIPNVGLSLKILIDAHPGLSIIVTGSSSLDLSGKLGEPLTGRQVPLRLFPLSIGEMRNSMNNYEIKQSLE
ncbi:MAG: AAA family ATPase, partial [Treponema sp.]|nr:AAA family ATPase [Treponema sp.]